jgi:predicted  nucleic acid-binding Zn-ribbon protein
MKVELPDNLAEQLKELQRAYDSLSTLAIRNEEYMDKARSYYDEADGAWDQVNEKESEINDLRRAAEALQSVVWEEKEAVRRDTIRLEGLIKKQAEGAKPALLLMQEVMVMLEVGGTPEEILEAVREKHALLNPVW